MAELAINGGRPVRERPWNVSFYIGKEEKEAVMEVIDGQWLSRFRGGEKVKEFEREFAKYCGAKYGITTTSGTTALHTAISTLKLQPGDEVIVPAMTFVSTASVVLQENAIPIFADIERETFCMDASDLEKRITDRTRTIIPVHLFGHPANMDKINNIAQKYGLAVIEDAAQAHGASIGGRKVGSLGDIGCFSFFQTKNMTCGEGGMLLTNNDEIYREARLSREHGSPETDKGWYFYDRLGYNYNMTEIQAAIGLVQLKKLDWMNAKRKEHAEAYRERLSGLELEFVHQIQKYGNVYHNFPIILPKKLSGGKRDWFVKAVSAEGVPIDVCYPIPLYKTNMFQNPSSKKFSKNIDYQKNPCPVAEDVSGRIVNLFTDPLLSKDLHEDICSSILKVLDYALK